MLFKTIIFSADAPVSKYARHFPVFLEYEVEEVEEKLPIESELKEKGVSEDVTFPLLATPSNPKGSTHLWFAAGFVPPQTANLNP